jgi:hypothetical protein
MSSEHKGIGTGVSNSQMCHGAHVAKKYLECTVLCICIKTIKEIGNLVYRTRRYSKGHTSTNYSKLVPLKLHPFLNSVVRNKF